MTTLFQIQQLNIWIFVFLSLVLLHTCHCDHPGGNWGERIQGQMSQKGKKVKKTLIAQCVRTHLGKMFPSHIECINSSTTEAKITSSERKDFFVKSLQSFLKEQFVRFFSFIPNLSDKDAISLPTHPCNHTASVFNKLGNQERHYLASWEWDIKIIFSDKWYLYCET